MARAPSSGSGKSLQRPAEAAVGGPAGLDEDDFPEVRGRFFLPARRRKIGFPLTVFRHVGSAYLSASFCSSFWGIFSILLSDRFCKFDFPRDLVGGKIGPAMLEQFPFLDLRAGFLHDDRLDDLPPEQVLLADDAGLLHGGMEAKDDLDLPGIDVEAAGDDHPFLPAGEEDVTVLVHPAEVARVEPAVLDDLGGHLLVLVVSLHDVVALEDEFADGFPRELPALLVDDFRLHAGDGDSDGARFLGHVETAEGGDGRRLGQAVALHDLDAEPLFEDGDEIRRHRRAAGDADLQGIGPVFFGALDGRACRGRASGTAAI